MRYGFEAPGGQCIHPRLHGRAADVAAGPAPGEVAFCGDGTRPSAITDCRAGLRPAFGQPMAVAGLAGPRHGLGGPRLHRADAASAPASRGDTVAWGARVSWACSRHRVRARLDCHHQDVRLRATTAVQHTAGRGTLALRLGAGGRWSTSRGCATRARAPGSRRSISGPARTSMLPAADLEAVVGAPGRGPWIVGLSGGPSVDLNCRRTAAGITSWGSHGSPETMRRALARRSGSPAAATSRLRRPGAAARADHAEVTGTPLVPATPNCNVALVWGEQWLVEALCILPPENDGRRRVLAAGCRDPFGFVPAASRANVGRYRSCRPSSTSDALPSADLLVGDVTARVGYGSLDGLRRPRRRRHARPRAAPIGSQCSDGMRQCGTDSGSRRRSTQRDVVYGASFVEDDRARSARRVSRGRVQPVAAFYPRGGCGDPPPGSRSRGRWLHRAGGDRGDLAGHAAAGGSGDVRRAAARRRDSHRCRSSTPATVAASSAAPSATAIERALPEPDDRACSPDRTVRPAPCRAPPATSHRACAQLVVASTADDACRIYALRAEGLSTRIRTARRPTGITARTRRRIGRVN